MLLNELVRQVIMEKKIDDLKKKFPEKTAIIDQLQHEIPEKYIEWAITQLNVGSKLQDLVPTIKYFEQNKQRFQNKDIYSYTGKTLEDEVKTISASKSKRQQTKELKAGGSEKIYEDEFDKIYFIKNKETAAKYGAGTKWCITMMDSQHWEEYNESNVLIYYIFSKENNSDPNLSKFAVSVERGLNNELLKSTVWNIQDEDVTKNFSNSSLIDAIESDAVQKPTPPGLIIHALKSLIDSEHNSAEYSEQDLKNYFQKICGPVFEKAYQNILIMSSIVEEAYHSPEESNFADYNHTNGQLINNFRSVLDPELLKKVQKELDNLFPEDIWMHGLEEKEQEAWEDAQWKKEQSRYED